jgi:hypothetical protein
LSFQRAAGEAALFYFYLFPFESRQYPDTAIKLPLTAGDGKWRIENRLRGASSWATL